MTYALLAEMMPSRHRGWSLVLVGGFGAVGGYFAASGLIAAWLQPEFRWRILWLANLPTGLLLVALGALIPESAKFLLRAGGTDEAQKVMDELRLEDAQGHAQTSRARQGPRDRAVGRAFVGKLAALSLTAIC